MISLKHKSKGFTIVELLIVIVVIGILATLVIVTFAGIQQKARDTKRKTDINAIDSHLEAAYAADGTYPSLAQLLSDSWRTDHMKGLDPKALEDPKQKSPVTMGATAGSDHYGYAPTGCDGSGENCSGFTLTANLEGSTDAYTKKSN